MGKKLFLYYDGFEEEMISYSTPLVPKQVRLELTNKCNAKCLPCHRNTMTRPLGNMDKGLVEKCLEDIRGFPELLVEIVPSGFGETFLYPNWVDTLALIARKLPRTRMVVPTNGTLLTNGVVADLCRIPTLKLVNISANAFLPETYESFHGLPAKHMETLKKAAVRIRQLRTDVTIWISMARDASYQSPREVELFREEWSKYGLVQINQCEFNSRPERMPNPPVKLPCRSLFSDLVVNWDGRITSCCYDADCNLIIDDAETKNLLDIWHSKEFSDLRKLHNEGKRGTNLKICKGCTFA